MNPTASWTQESQGSKSSVGSTGPIEVYEVTQAGEVAWHLEVGGAVSSMYRATPLFEF